MDKGIVFSILIAAVVSIGAAMFWDKIVDTPKAIDETQNTDEFDKTIGPNKDTLEITEKPNIPDIITSPNEHKPKKSASPDRQAKPTPTNPFLDNNNTENTSETTLTNSHTQDKIHIVKKGDSLARISKKYYETEKYWEFLQKYNNLPNINLDINQKLRIPAEPEN